MVASPDKDGERESPAVGRRVLSSTRLAAVQAIYQLDMTGEAAETVVAEFIRHRGGVGLEEDGEEIKTDKVLFASSCAASRARKTSSTACSPSTSSRIGRLRASRR